jgi:anti-anti-sigma factor
MGQEGVNNARSGSLRPLYFAAVIFRPVVASRPRVRRTAELRSASFGLAESTRATATTLRRLPLGEHRWRTRRRRSGAHVDSVQILGDVDLPNARELGGSASQLIDHEASIIYIDLGGVRFIGSTLISSLTDACNNGDTRRPMVLRRPTPMALRVIRITGLDQLASVHSELPPQWPYSQGLDHPADE